MRPSNCTFLISVPVAWVWQILHRVQATSCAGVFTNEAHPFASSDNAAVAMTSAVVARRCCAQTANRHVEIYQPVLASAVIRDRLFTDDAS